ncbi:MAG: hypothetical protein UY92_C0014G0002 [Candidatus Magasanikbacteria bacterium GW2011_GWA2_56_11]|uniref:Uncharacterized protein n=1 Tax=Candidatus Magasanikbacteria bacterium GW2011_GWA2_56_11 TaxID=1619044 RepID=A0A0G2AKC3_9BACT|nr:MAG: hypothetical protein UY92_C0014G0002 [Candidatus Magasanikbacteria bacterium GW2011_GWA2_56_11]
MSHIRSIRHPIENEAILFLIVIVKRPCHVDPIAETPGESQILKPQGPLLLRKAGLQLIYGCERRMSLVYALISVSHYRV